MSTKRLGLAVSTLAGVVLSAAALATGGCSTVDQLVNRGGETTCKEFNGHDEEKQRSEVSKMLTDRDGGEPSNLELNATRLAVSAYCKTLGKDSSKISEVTP